jgi:predicted DNA-binding protein YlxM (UPF0122 family)
MGRPATVDDKQRTFVTVKLAEGLSVSELARQLKTSRQTITCAA